MGQLVGRGQLNLQSVDDTMFGGRFERFFEIITSDAQEIAFQHFAPVTVAGIEAVSFRVSGMHHRHNAHRILR